ncbi:MAG: hypothetical protein QGH20_11460, partial [Candidatus Latescibacteria bacterium]|nr:hypothetical protein [Candidatus Latescibacterota bacterium]
MYEYEKFLPGLVATTLSFYPRQVRDPNRRDNGAFIADIYGCAAADHASNAGMLACACIAFMADGSNLQGDDELYSRILDSIDFQRRWQRPSGLVDLIQIDWDDPATTGFTVNQLGPVVNVARRLSDGADGERCSIIASELGEYVRTASAGMVGGGFHTPNHRWVICSAVAHGMALYPEIDGLGYVESI